MRAQPHRGGAPNVSVPSLASAIAFLDEFGRARRCGLDGQEEARYERPEIGELVGSRLEHNVLLKGQVSIDCYEYVELRRREGEQLPVLERRPSHLTGGFHLVRGKLAAEPPVNTLVEQHPH